jgi:hypothetical protein
MQTTEVAIEKNHMNRVSLGDMFFSIEGMEKRAVSLYDDPKRTGGGRRGNLESAGKEERPVADEKILV